MKKNTKKNLLKRIVIAGLVCGNILAYNDMARAANINPPTGHLLKDNVLTINASGYSFNGGASVSGTEWAYVKAGVNDSSENTNVENNTITISGGKFTVAVYGGYVYNKANSHASGNTITITGGIFSNFPLIPSIYGGYATGAGSNALNNTVILSQTSAKNTDCINGHVYGGFSGGGLATGNTVKIRHNASVYSDRLELAYLYGSNVTPSDYVTDTTANVLDLTEAKYTVKVKAITNFNVIKYGTNIVENTKPYLDLGGTTGTLSYTTIDITAITDLTLMPEKITLMSASKVSGLDTVQLKTNSNFSSIPTKDNPTNAVCMSSYGLNQVDGELCISRLNGDNYGGIYYDTAGNAYNADHLTGGAVSGTLNVGATLTTTDKIYAGAYAESNKTATGGTVNITGGALTGDIYAGYSVGGAVTGNIMNITATSTGYPNLAAANLKGSNIVLTASITGTNANVLDLTNMAKALTVKTIANFDEVKIGSNTKTITMTGSSDFKYTTIDATAIKDAAVIGSELILFAGGTINTNANTTVKIASELQGYTVDTATNAVYMQGFTGTVSSSKISITQTNGTNYGGIYYDAAGKAYNAEHLTGGATSGTLNVSANLTTTGKIYAGAYAESNKTATGGTVNITGGTLKGDIYAGYSDSGDVIGNRMNITATSASSPTINEANLKGSNKSTAADTPEANYNILDLTGMQKDLGIKSISNFDKIIFGKNSGKVYLQSSGDFTNTIIDVSDFDASTIGSSKTILQDNSSTMVTTNIKFKFADGMTDYFKDTYNGVYVKSFSGKVVSNTIQIAPVNGTNYGGVYYDSTGTGHAVDSSTGSIKTATSGTLSLNLTSRLDVGTKIYAGAYAEGNTIAKGGTLTISSSGVQVLNGTVYAGYSASGIGIVTGNTMKLITTSSNYPNLQLAVLKGSNITPSELVTGNDANVLDLTEMAQSVIAKEISNFNVIKLGTSAIYIANTGTASLNYTTIDATAIKEISGSKITLISGAISNYSNAVLLLAPELKDGYAKDTTNNSVHKEGYTTTISATEVSISKTTGTNYAGVYYDSDGKGYNASDLTSGTATTGTMNVGTNLSTSGKIYAGAYAEGSKTATGGTVNITAGTLNGNIYAGYSVSGDVTGNTMNITGGTINGGDIYAGYSNSGTGIVKGNTIVVGSGANVTTAKLHGSNTTNGANNVLDLSARSSNFNIKSIDKFNTIIVGTGNIVLDQYTVSDLSYTVIDATAVTPAVGVSSKIFQNEYSRMTVTGTTVKVAPSSYVIDTATYGVSTVGYSSSISSKYIQVLGTAGSNIAGVYYDSEGKGYNKDNLTAGTATGGTLTISSTPSAGKTYYGAYAEGSATAKGGTIKITGGSIGTGLTIYGGYSVNGDVKDNIVDISGGTISGKVYGGKSGNVDAIISGNTINWSGGTIQGSEIMANKINISGTGAMYSYYNGTMTADETVSLTGKLNVNSSCKLTITNGLDAGNDSDLCLYNSGSTVVLKGTGHLATVTGGGTLEIATDAAVTHTAGKTVTLNTLTLTSGGLIIDPDDLVVSARITNNVVGGLVFNGTGELKASSNGIKGTGTTVINGGEVTSKGVIEQSIVITNSTDKLIIEPGNLKGDVTNAGTVELSKSNSYRTLNKTIMGGNITIASTAIVISDLAKLAGAITNNGELYVSGVLSNNIAGASGKTVVYGGTLTANDSATKTIEGTLDMNNGILDMQGGGANKLSVGTFKGAGKIKLDVVLGGTVTNSDVITLDTINATSVNSSGSINLSNLNVIGTSTEEQWAVGTTKEHIPFINSSSITALSINRAYAATGDGYIYQFDQQGTKSGELKVTKQYGYSLAQFIQNNKAAADTDCSPNTFTTYGLTKDITLTDNINVRKNNTEAATCNNYGVWDATAHSTLSNGNSLGTLVARSTADEPFTINGNSYTLKGGNKGGVTIDSALVLNLNNLAKVEGFNGYFVDNQAGTVNISAAGITGANAGTMILNSVLKGAGAYNLLDGILKVTDLGNLAMTGTDGLNNSGVVQLGVMNSTATLAAAITGTGTTEIIGKITDSGYDIAQSGLTIVSDGILAIATNNLKITSGTDAGTVTNNGQLTLSADGTLEENISGTGYINVNANVTATGIINNMTTNLGANNKGIQVYSGKQLSINASNLQTVTANSGTVALSGGTLANGNAIKGGAISVTGDTEANADDLVSASGITNTSNLTLNGGTLKDNISGAGTTVIKDGSVVKMDGSKNLLSGQNLTINGVLDMKEASGETEVYKELAVNGNLTAGTNGKINFGVKLDGMSGSGGDLTDTTKYDHIVVGGSTSGILQLGGIALSANDTLDTGAVVYFQLVSSSGTNNITVGGTFSSAVGMYNYVFSDASTVAGKGNGWVKVVKGLGFTLAEIVRGKGVSDGGATVTTWSMSGNTNLDVSEDNSQYNYNDDGTVVKDATDMGTLATRSGTGAVELVMNGNGFDLSGGNGAKNGITVPVGGMVSVVDMGKVSGFDEYFIKNLGTLNFKGDTSSTPATAATTTLQSAITGSGNMYLKEAVIVDATDDNAKIAQNTINIAAGTKLILKDDTNLNITNGINNSGTVELTGTGSSTDIYGLNTGNTLNRIIGGTTNISGTVNAVGNSLTSTDVVVTSAGILNIAAGTTTNLTADAGIANITVDFTGSSADDYSKLGMLSTVNNGKINILGGVITDKINAQVVLGQVTILEGATYQAAAGSIFSNTSTTGISAGGLRSDVKINFDGGIFEFTDAICTVEYLTSAKGLLTTAQIKTKGEIVKAGGGNITTTDASNLGETIVLPKAVVVATEKNTLIGSTDVTTINVTGIGDMEDKRANGFNVDKLDLKSGSVGLAITNGKKVVIGGNGHDGNLITVNGATQNVNVVVGTKTTVAGATDNKGNLGIGITGSIASQGYKLQGNIEVNTGSKVEVNGNTEIIGNVNLVNNAEFLAAENVKVVMNGLDLDDSSMSVGDGAVVETNTLTAGSTQENGLESSITGKVEVKDKFIIGKSSKAGETAKPITILVGDSTGKGEVIAKNIQLGGNIIFVDPAWVPGVGVEGASEVATETTTLDGTYVAGQNAIIAFGTTDASAARTLFNETKLTWGPSDITAAAYVAQPINVSNGALIVDGSKTVKPTNISANGTVNFATQSLLLVDGNVCQSVPAISGVNAANLKIDTTAGSGSKLYIANASSGVTYKIIDGVTSISDAWNTVLASEDKQIASIEVEGGVYTVTFKGSSTYYYQDTLIPLVAIAMTLAEDGHPANTYMKSIADYGALVSHEGMVQAINGLAKMNANMGVSHGQFTVSNITEDSVSEHLSIQNGKLGKEIWAKALHTKENVDGLGLVTSEAYKGQYNGTIVGVDLVQTDKFTMGAALTYIKGDVNTNSASKNETKHTGITVYGRQTLPNDEAVSFDLSFLHGTNDMRLHTAAINSTVTGDQNVNSFSLGGRWEKKIAVSKNSSILPHAGLRWLHMRNSAFSNSLGMHYDGVNTNTFILPVGIGIKAGVQSGSWRMSVKGDLGYQLNMGNKDQNQTVSFREGMNSFDVTFVDRSSWYASAGVEFAKKNFTAGIGYRYAKSSGTRQNRWDLNLSWAF